MGITAYNLIRHAMVQMGNPHKISYCRFSFSRFVSTVNAHEGSFISQRMAHYDKMNALDRALIDYKSLLLLIRKKPRPNEPSKVWPKGTLKIMRSSRAVQRKTKT